MSWINRFTARIGSAVAIAAVLLAAVPARPAFADQSINAAYQQQTIRFTHLVSTNAGVAIGVEDPGLAALLHATGAVMTWKPGDKYVMITTSVPVVASFMAGDRRYDVGPIAMQAPFAPFMQGNEAYLPFDDVLRSMDLALRQDGGMTVLQPQLASLDVRADGGRVTMVAHGGAPLRPRIASDTAGAITYEFDGVGTTLAGARQVNAGGVKTVTIAQAGTVRDPKTLVTVWLAPGASHETPRSNDDRDIVLAFSGPGAQATAAQPPAQTAMQPPPNGASGDQQSQEYQGPPPGVAPGQYPAGQNGPPQTGPATVTGVNVQSGPQGYTVQIAVTGNAAFEWHRLRDPDNRFWVDIKGAQLQGPPIDQAEPDPLTQLRVRQVDPSTVRVAISLSGPKSLAVSPGTNGLTVDVGTDDVADAVRAGSGSVGTIVSSGEQVGQVTPAPIDEYGGQPGGPTADANWKFGPRAPVYVPTNPRLIVIDPGHGGSDRGAIHGNLAEADVTLDMAKRLRDILIARGWQVQMTHDTDVDVYGPDATAHQELQARVDVANNAGARLFVSIHANSFINSGPYGTTCYISKTSDAAFARMVEHELANDGTKDDGVIKSHLYVTLHSLMPAVLVEAAFLSNPGDFELLSSSAWRQKVVTEIADGIGQYTQAYPVQNQNAQ